jgi:hypothetical protein
VGIAPHTVPVDTAPEMKHGVAHATATLREAYATPAGIARHFIDERAVAAYAARFPEWHEDFGIIAEVVKQRNNGPRVAREPFEPTICHASWDFVGKGFHDDAALAPLLSLAWRRYRFFDDDGRGATLHFLEVLTCDDPACATLTTNPSAFSSRILLLGPPVTAGVPLDDLVVTESIPSIGSEQAFFVRSPDGWVLLKKGALRAKRADRAGPTTASSSVPLATKASAPFALSAVEVRAEVDVDQTRRVIDAGLSTLVDECLDPRRRDATASVRLRLRLDARGRADLASDDAVEAPMLHADCVTEWARSLRFSPDPERDDHVVELEFRFTVTPATLADWRTTRKTALSRYCGRVEHEVKRGAKAREALITAAALEAGAPSLPADWAALLVRMQDARWPLGDVIRRANRWALMFDCAAVPEDERLDAISSVGTADELWPQSDLWSNEDPSPELLRAHRDLVRQWRPDLSTAERASLAAKMKALRERVVQRGVELCRQQGLFPVPQAQARVACEDRSVPPIDWRPVKVDRKAECARVGGEWGLDLYYCDSRCRTYDERKACAEQRTDVDGCVCPFEQCFITSEDGAKATCIVKPPWAH